MEQTYGTGTHGNTNARAKRRAHMVTGWEREFIHNELPSNATYLCFCEDYTSIEKGSKWHQHAFIYFKNPVSLASIKKLFGKQAHDEKPESNSDCIAYCKGEKKKPNRKFNFNEFGKPPMDNGQHRTVRELAELDDPSDLNWNQYNTWKQVHQEKGILTNDWNKHVDVYYIYGPSGIGKSLFIRMFLEANEIESFEEVKYDNGFWNGVITGEGCCVYDDFRTTMKASEFINFIDYNIHNLNIKGGHIKNKYDIILISSIKNPHHLYPNEPDESKAQWIRRLHIIDMELYLTDFA